jgi:hypothetical protein
MDKFDITSKAIFKKSPASINKIFDNHTCDYKSLALTLIEFNKAVYELADHLRQAHLTYSEISSKKQNKG